MTGKLRFLLLVILPAVLGAQKLKEGVYRGTLAMDSLDKTIPFIFSLHKAGRNWTETIYNGDEKIVADETVVKGDSFFVRMPLFDSEFRSRVTRHGLSGIWVNHGRKKPGTMHFDAAFGEKNRFTSGNEQPHADVSGTWKTVFSPGTPDSSKAIGTFTNVEGSGVLHGTFLTETGDYRFLEGAMTGNSFSLSCFDGAHAYLFTATVSGQSMAGDFYSGSHYHCSWNATRNDTFRLRDPLAITYMDEKPLDFSFADSSGKPVSLSDAEFAGKPVIVQVMGSWCPNCVDEARYLSGLYQSHHSEGLRIVALAFERPMSEVKARSLVSRFARRIGVPYPVLVTGFSGADGVYAALPGMHNFISFPTTIFLDRTHRPVRVHAGFSGPATGGAYDDFRRDTESIINALLK